MAPLVEMAARSAVMAFLYIATVDMGLSISAFLYVYKYARIPYMMLDMHMSSIHWRAIKACLLCVSFAVFPDVRYEDFEYMFVMSS